MNLLTAFSVIVRDDEKSYEESVHSVSLNATCEQLKASLNPEGKLLIISLSDTIASISELKLKPLLKPLYEKKSNTLLKDKVILKVKDIYLHCFKKKILISIILF